MLLLLQLLSLRAYAEETVQQQLAAIAATLDPVVQRTLLDVEGLPRQLLAARAYLRAGPKLRERWSWSEAEIAAFNRSPARQRLLADIKAVTAVFESLNPGFTLYVNTEVRSLGVQLERWNKHRTVGLLADELHAAALEAIGAGQGLRQVLIDWQPSSAAPLSAPGLGLHGRARAVDFQIRQGERIVAGTEAASVATDWDAAGWTQKLQRAVERSALPFRGPLLSPREPWHYEHVPGPQ
jgi:hypothetical protein